MRQLSQHTKIVRLPLDTTTTYVGAAGTTALTSEGLDVRGFEGALILVQFGAIVSGAVTSIKVQQSSDDAATDAYSDLAGTSVSVADDQDNLVFGVDIWRPQKRYLTVVITRGTQNATVDSIMAILYGASHRTITEHATVATVETFVSPSEGTA